MRGCETVTYMPGLSRGNVSCIFGLDPKMLYPYVFVADPTNMNICVLGTNREEKMVEMISPLLVGGGDTAKDVRRGWE